MRTNLRSKGLRGFDGGAGLLKTFHGGSTTAAAAAERRGTAQGKRSCGAGSRLVSFLRSPLSHAPFQLDGRCVDFLRRWFWFRVAEQEQRVRYQRVVGHGHSSPVFAEHSLNLETALERERERWWRKSREQDISVSNLMGGFCYINIYILRS